MPVDPKLWNQAMDMVINDMLSETKVIQPDKDGCRIEVVFTEEEVGRKSAKVAYTKCWTCGELGPRRLVGRVTEQEAKDGLTMLSKSECVMNWKEDWYG